MKEFIDKLTERLEEYKTKAYVTGITNNPYEFGACNAMDSAIRIVNELAEEYKLFGNSEQVKGGWISVSERLPKENVLDTGYVEPSDAVLVFTKYNSYNVSRYWGNRRNKRDYYDWVDINYRENEVIAWQPIAPYTEGE